MMPNNQHNRLDSNQESPDKIEKSSGPQPAEAYDKFSDFKI